MKNADAKVIVSDLIDIIESLKIIVDAADNVRNASNRIKNLVDELVVQEEFLGIISNSDDPDAIM